MLRAVLFGAGWTFAVYPIAFLLFPGFFPPNDRRALAFRCLRCTCIGYGPMDGNAVARDFIMAKGHRRMDRRVLHNRHLALDYCRYVGPTNLKLMRYPKARARTANNSCPTLTAGGTNRQNYSEAWRSLGESNPCFSLERAAS